jgi:hypothetical protein
MNTTYDTHRALQVRASDADREQTAEILRSQYAEGLLDGEELQQRIDAGQRAKTISDLVQLIADLPARAGAQQRHAAVKPRHLRLPRPWLILIPLAVMAMLTGHPFLFFALPLLLLAVHMVAPARSVQYDRGSGQWA